MKIDLKKITVRELFEGYVDKQEEGVRGYGGRLNIRPAYQREFIYKDKQRNEVIHTVRKGFPLNTMYWVVAGDGYELMDGQQRTISLCQYVAGDFAIEIDKTPYFFSNLTAVRQQEILDYELQIYVCEGTDQAPSPPRPPTPLEGRGGVGIINIAGKKLTDQELRNAIYSGPWLADAKRWFSKTGCPAYAIGEKYVNGSPIRQEFLETALEWISGGKVEEYMAGHQHDPNASALWRYFQDVVEWSKATFPKYRKEMKGVDWGGLHAAFKDQVYDTAKLEEEVSKLMMDDDVTKKSGVYPYVLTRAEKHLNIRQFTDNQKREAYERQKGVCPVCGETFEIGQMEADHIQPWHEGGKTAAANCKMLCRADNRTKGGK